MMSSGPFSKLNLAVHCAASLAEQSSPAMLALDSQVSQYFERTQQALFADDRDLTKHLAPALMTAGGGSFTVESPLGPARWLGASELSAFHCSLLLQTASYLRSQLAQLRAESRTADLQSQRSSRALQNSTANKTSVPHVVGIGLGSNFAMLRALAVKQPEKCLRVLNVLNSILGNLKPLSLRSQDKPEFALLQEFLTTMSESDSAPLRQNCLTVMMSLALTRGTAESTFSAIRALSQSNLEWLTLPPLASQILSMAQRASRELAPPKPALQTATGFSVPLRALLGDINAKQLSSAPIQIALARGSIPPPYVY